MISLTLFTLAVLWIAALRRYPSFFISKTAPGLARLGNNPVENWIEVMPAGQHHEAHAFQRAV